MRRLLLASALLVAACKGDKPAPAKAPPAAKADRPTEVFHTRGKVTQVTEKQLVIHHEKMDKIRSYEDKLVPMASMSMPFAKGELPAAQAIVAGDVVSISFTVHYDSDPTLRITALEKLPADTQLELSSGM